MVGFEARLTDGWRRMTGLKLLLSVPIVTALLSVGNISKVLAFHGIQIGVQLFGFPSGIVDVWQFVNTPNTTGSGVHFAAPIWAIAAVTVVRSVLTAGYFGSIRESLETGSYSFGASVRRFLVPFLIYSLAGFVLTLGALIVLLNPIFIVVVIVLGLVLSYLFYPVPYLLVLRECGLIEAVHVSYGLAVEGRPYVRYTVGICVLTVAVSIFATLIVVNLSSVGILVGAVAAAPLGLALNIATMRFVADIDPGSPAFGTWDDGDGSNGGANRAGTDDGVDRHDRIDGVRPAERDRGREQSNGEEFGLNRDDAGGRNRSARDGRNGRDERRRSDDY